LTSIYSKCGISHKKNSSQTVKIVLELFFGGLSKLTKFKNPQQKHLFVLKISHLGACRGKTREQKYE
tara:strand:- start:2822 stop:3022 length:201 start_codon:yes stop_codon:yes gene_type:complete